MDFRIVLFAVLFCLTLLPLGWNKFDMARHAQMIFLLGGALPILGLLSLKDIFEKTKSGFVEIILLFGFFAFLMLSFSRSILQNYGWSEVVVMGVGIVCYFLAQTWKKQERDFFAILLVGISILSVVVSIYWYLTFSENRMAGLFFDYDRKANLWPNAFALFLLMSWPVVLSYLQRISSWKLWKSFLLALIFSVLILTFSRAAFLTFLGQLFLLFFLFRRAHKISYRPLILTILLTVLVTFSIHQTRVAISAYQTNSFAAKARFEGTERQTSLLERAQFMKGAFQLMQEKPLTGYGVQIFRWIYPRQMQPEFLAVSDHPHNWYLKLAMENGIPSAVFFLVFLAVVFWKKRKKIFSLEEEGFYAIAIAGVLVHSLVDYNLNFLTNQLLFWTILGMLQGSEEANVEHVGATGFRFWRRLFTTFFLAFIFLLSSEIVQEGVLSYQGRNNVALYAKAHFPREYFFDQARLKRGAGDPSESMKMIELHLARNPYDAFAWNFRGQLLETRGDLKLAYESYTRAVESDPANFFAFYVDAIRIGKKFDMEHDPGLVPYLARVKTFLQQYPDMIRNNVHYTAQSTNPVYATQLAILLGETTLEQEIRQAQKDWAASRI